MKRNIIWGMSTLSALVLLAAYRTSLAGPEASPSAEVSASATATSSQTTAATDRAGAGTAPSAPTLPGATSGSSSSAKTVTGRAATTRYGPVQVQITVLDGKITAAKAVRFPHSSEHDARVNARAIPVLNAAAVRAQNADLDSVSGATVTSLGYRQSLQSAIDAASL